MIGLLAAIAQLGMMILSMYQAQMKEKKEKAEQMTLSHEEFEHLVGLALDQMRSDARVDSGLAQSVEDRMDS